MIQLPLPTDNSIYSNKAQAFFLEPLLYADLRLTAGRIFYIIKADKKEIHTIKKQQR